MLAAMGSVDMLMGQAAAALMQSDQMQHRQEAAMAALVCRHQLPALRFAELEAAAAEPTQQAAVAHQRPLVGVVLVAHIILPQMPALEA